MRRCAILLTAALVAPALSAQRHGGSAAPPTAQAAPPQSAIAPIVPVSSGLGSIQFVQVNYGVPAPQSLTRQLRFDDDRTRSSALSAIGVPGQYLQRGRIPMPRSVRLDMLAMGNNDELDALITIELEQHIVTAVLVPEDGNWRRVATLIFSTPFEDRTTTPSTWLRTARSLVAKDRYRAIFHASSGSMDGNFVENEAQLRIQNNRAIITISFESMARECSPKPVAGKPTPRSSIRPGCDVRQRWFQADPADPSRKFVLVTGTGHLAPKEVESPFADARTMLTAQLRNFSCQPYTYSELSQHYEPSAANGACRAK